MNDIRTVLLVEDDEPLRLAAAQAFELADLDVVAVADADAALARLTDDWPGAVVSDIRMPGMDGMELLRRIQGLDPDLPVVLVTGHGDVAMAVQAMRSGAYDFIEKPFASDHLVDVVKRALEKRRLVMENRSLRQRLAETDSPLIGRSPGIERLRKTIAAVADTDADVLVIGETGSGKEMVARALHEASRQRGGPFVALNCGAMPESIFESELFGHAAGAFTGAAQRRVGRIQHAHRGTLFLDEIESMPLALQVKLLRVLQDRMVEPLGTNEQVAVDLRVVAASKVDLRRAAAEGLFREDLYYRLNVVVVAIPPLRERRDDIPLLFQHFLDLAAQRYGRAPPAPDPDQMRRLLAHCWPGNVRELRNAADRYVLGVSGLDDFETEAVASGGTSLSDQVEAFEKALIEQALARHNGSVKATIESLGLPRKTFYDKLRRHGLCRGDFV